MEPSQTTFDSLLVEPRSKSNASGSPSVSLRRPRARLLLQGSTSLSDPELLAVILSLRGDQGLSLARDLLAGQGFGYLAALSPSRLRYRGAPPESLHALLAAFELARRLAAQEIQNRPLLDRPALTARYLALHHAVADQEVFGALFLDARNCLITSTVVYRGTLRTVAAEPRAVFVEALTCGAAGIILFHTHPSGDPSPSAADFAVTKRFQSAAQLLEIPVIDHLVVTHSGRWASLIPRSLSEGLA